MSEIEEVKEKLRILSVFYRDLGEKIRKIEQEVNDLRNMLIELKEGRNINHKP